jgi:hypothetical protein
VVLYVCNVLCSVLKEVSIGGKEKDSLVCSSLFH